MSTGKHFRLNVEEDGLGVLTFDSVEEKVNKYDEAVFRELEAALGEIEGRRDVKAVLLVSGKPGMFIAGADVKQIATADATSVAPAIERGQRLFDRLAALKVPTVAAIAGSCVGGGLETALACDWRLASDGPRVQIGLPEVKLGILPAWGGTSRLPRVIGLPGALDLILTGRALDGRRAVRAGVVDEVVPDALLARYARRFALQKAEKPKRANAAADGGPVRARPRKLSEALLEGPGRFLVFRKARQGVMKQTGGHYPAPLEALAVVEKGFGGPLQRSLRLECEHAAKLVGTPVMRNLVTLFLRMEAVKKQTGLEGLEVGAGAEATPTHVRRVGVLGAGVMGGGIAQLAADHGLPARMKDIAPEALAAGFAASAKIWNDKMQRRRLRKHEMAERMARLSGTLDYSGFGQCQVTVEAVAEKLPVKQAVLREWEGHVPDVAIFASNTSTLPITEIQKAAQVPERVAGMHFFNPVHRMPLVEVIYGEKTSSAVTSTVFDLARRMGKTPVVVKDGPGFLVNRILGPYLGEAGRLLAEGYTIESIDAAMRRLGMPVGPIELLDDVGLDVAAKGSETLAAAWPERMTLDPKVVGLVEKGRVGRKAKKGFYRYENGHRRGVDPAAFADLGVAVPQQALTAEEAEARMVLPMINEAVHCLSDGVVVEPAKLDLAMIFGTGFPPFRGGPLRHADARGLRKTVDDLQRLEQKHGARFAPAPELVERASADRVFFD